MNIKLGDEVRIIDVYNYNHLKKFLEDRTPIPKEKWQDIIGMIGIVKHPVLSQDRLSVTINYKDQEVSICIAKDNLRKVTELEKEVERSNNGDK